jgi:hypothetical protein
MGGGDPGAARCVRAADGSGAREIAAGTKRYRTLVHGNTRPDKKPQEKLHLQNNSLHTVFHDAKCRIPS